MITNEDIKTGLIAYIKSKSTITDVLANSDEVREFQWQGTEFSYPCTRLRIIENVPYNDCAYSVVICSFLVFSQDASSKEADEITGIIANELHETSFSSSGVKYNLWVTNLIPAVRQDERTWRSEVMLKGIVS